MRHTTRTLIVMAMVQMAMLSLCYGQQALEVTEKMKAIIKKNESFGLKKFPISMWNYTNLREDGAHFTEAAMQALADAGVTVPQGPNYDPSKPAEMAKMRKMLDWAQKRDMKLILKDPRCHGMHEKNGKPPANYAAGVRKAVADFGKHPATFGFFIGDEVTGEAMEAFGACQKIQKKAAPHLFSFFNHLPAMGAGWGKFLDDYMRASNADIIGYDRYTQMNIDDREGGIATYYESLRVYREASLRHGVPFWNSPMSIGHNQYRCPNLDDFRWQLNTSVAAGANGIVWFFWYHPRPGGNYRLAPMDMFWEKTQTYHDIRRVQQTFHKTYGNLFSKLVSTRVSFYPKGRGGGETWKPNELLAGLWPAYDKIPALVGEFTDIKGRRYVMVVNDSQTETDRLLIKFPKNAKIYSFGFGSEGKEYLENDGSRQKQGLVEVWRWLAPGQSALFRVETGK